MQIERNIPIPTSGRGRPAHYDLSQMEVGDSFIAHLHQHKGPQSVSHMIHAAQKKTGYTFTRRTQPDGFIRIWRTS